LYHKFSNILYQPFGWGFTWAYLGIDTYILAYMLKKNGSFYYWLLIFEVFFVLLLLK